MKFLQLTFLMSIFVFNSEAAVFNGEFSTPVTTIKEGDVIEGTITIWPVESTDDKFAKGLEGKLLLNAYFLQQVASAGPSENNADAFEIKGIFIVRSTDAKSFQSLPLGNDAVDLKWDARKIDALKTKEKDFHIESQSVFKRNIWKILAVVSVILVICLVVFRKKIKNMFSRKSKPVYTAEYFDELFRAASTRADFENIYALKNVWLPLLKVQTSSHNDFFKIMNQHQYKKTWGVDETTDTKSAFENIRRSFSV